MATTVTLKIPRKLKVRIKRLATQTGRTPNDVILEALEREVGRAERVRDFVREALAADAAIEAGAEVYRAEDVHAWLTRLGRVG